MDRPNQSFDDVLRGGDSAQRDQTRGLRLRGTGASSGGFAVGAWSAAALFSAAAAAVLLLLSIRDDEASLGVGVSIALGLLSSACLIGAAVSVASVDGRRWPSGVAVAMVALLCISLVAWAQLTSVAASAYAP